MNQFKIIETDRLILKLADLNDAEFYLKLVNTPKWLKFIGDRKVYNIADAKKYIEVKMLPQHEKLGYGNYTVINKSDNQKMGSCGLYNREGLEGLDIGFAFFEKYEGFGYAFEAAKKLKEMAFNKFGITKLSAITTQDNFSSQKLLIKLGLQPKELIRLPDDSEELMLYEIEEQ